MSPVLELELVLVLVLVLVHIGCPALLCFSQWMELTLTLILTLSLTHRKYTDDCPLVTLLG